MKTYKIILLGFLWCCTDVLYSQQHALEYQFGLHQIRLLYRQGEVDRPNDNNYLPRFGVHYYHRLSKSTGIKTGLRLINERYNRSRVYNDPTPLMPENYVFYRLEVDLLAIDIPANLRIEFNQGNPRFFVEMGFSLSMYWKERSKLKYRREEIPPALAAVLPSEKFIAYDDDHAFGIPINLNAGIRYDFNEKFGLILQPFLSYDTSRQGRNPNKLYTLLFGVQMGVVQFL